MGYFTHTTAARVAIAVLLTQLITFIPIFFGYPPPQLGMKMVMGTVLVALFFAPIGFILVAERKARTLPETLIGLNIGVCIISWLGIVFSDHRDHSLFRISLLVIAIESTLAPLLWSLGHPDPRPLSGEPDLEAPEV